MNLTRFTQLKEKVVKAVTLLGAFLLPTLALAQAPNPENAALTELTGVVGTFGNIVNYLVPIMAALAIVFFFYGLAKYILAAGDEEAQADGKSIMIKGLIAIFIIVALYGIIAFLGELTGINTDTSATDRDVNPFNNES